MYFKDYMKCFLYNSYLIHSQFNNIESLLLVKDKNLLNKLLKKYIENIDKYQ